MSKPTGGSRIRALPMNVGIFCKGCGAESHVKRPTIRPKCAKCGDETSLDPTWWPKRMFRVLLESESVGWHELKSKGAPKCHLGFRRQGAVVCPDCKGETEARNLLETTTTGSWSCAHCGARFPLLQPRHLDTQVPDLVQCIALKSALDTPATTRDQDGREVWYLLFDEADAAGFSGRDRARYFDWDKLYDLCADAEGNLYATGSQSGPLTLWSLTAEHRTRWVCADPLPFDPHDKEVRFAGEHRGILYVWSPNCSALVRIDANTGKVLGTLGGQEPADARAHHLDLCGCAQLCVSADGTLLGNLHDRLLRWDLEGTPLRTWQPLPLHWRLATLGIASWEHMAPLYSSKAKGDPDRASDCPHRKPRECFLTSNTKHPTDRVKWNVRYGQIATGWDGTATLLTQEDGHIWIQRYSRQGTQEFRVQLPIDSVSPAPTVRLDDAGYAYLLIPTEDEHVLLRLSPDASTLAVLSKWRKASLSTSFAVTPQGSVTLVTSGDKLERLPPAPQPSPATKGDQQSPKSGSEDNDQAASSEVHFTVGEALPVAAKEVARSYRKAWVIVLMIVMAMAGLRLVTWQFVLCPKLDRLAQANGKLWVGGGRSSLSRAIRGAELRRLARNCRAEPVRELLLILFLFMALWASIRMPLATYGAVICTLTLFLLSLFLIPGSDGGIRSDVPFTGIGFLIALTYIATFPAVMWGVFSLLEASHPPK